jgi:hypothetical protein
MDLLRQKYEMFFICLTRAYVGSEDRCFTSNEMLEPSSYLLTSVHKSRRSQMAEFGQSVGESRRQLGITKAVPGE